MADFGIPNKADREFLEEMSNEDIYYQLFNTYKLVKWLSEKEKIHEQKLDITLRLLSDLAMVYGAKWVNESLQQDD